MGSAEFMIPKSLARVCIVTPLLAAAAAPAHAESAPGPREYMLALQERVDGFFGVLVDSFMVPVLFYAIGGVPLIVAVLALGGAVFTIRFRLVNFRLFGHALQITRGRYDDPDDAGEVSHFQALSAALAATVGLGNIAGVAIAITHGGPGAIFWMWVTAFLGMSTKFSECTLSQVYRDIRPDGHVIGGPMIYIKEGIRERWPALAGAGAVLSAAFAVLIILASFGGGNMFQSNQTYQIAAEMFGLEDAVWFQLGIGLLLAFLVALVVVGGIKRIGEVTSRLVPAMCAGYVAVCLVIVLSNASAAPGLLIDIVVQAFRPDAALYGGFVGVMVFGMQRAAFSNEAGLGSAPIAHAAAKTSEPVREGAVAMLGPFIDTIVVCTMTALAILVTGVHLDADGMEGVQVTAAAFATVHAHLPYFLTLAVFVFAYSTLLAWGYYGERAMEYLTGGREWLMWGYRAMFVVVVILGPMLSLHNLVGFVDILFLTAAVPNIVAMVLISGKVRDLKNDYLARLESGAMPPRR